MKIRSAMLALLASWIGSAQSAPTVQIKEPQRRPAAYTNVKAQQSLGRIVLTPDGKTILFEWGRPYLNWTPDVSWIAPAAARRLETALFIVDLTADKPVADYLVYPGGGSSYWLGDVAPDTRSVAIFELDHDTRSVRAGSWSLVEKKIRWFAPRPDEGRLGGVTAWLSNVEFMYPAAKSEKSRFILASALTGYATACPQCSDQSIKDAELSVNETAERAKSKVPQQMLADLPKGAQLTAASEDGQVAVFVRDDADVLALYYRLGAAPTQALFENWRREKPPK